MIETAFSSRQREALDDDWMPAWTVDAACRGIELPGRPWRDAFTDEIAAKPNPEDYVWAERTVTAMKVCHTCPVQMACLAYSIAEVTTTRHFGVFGGVPGRIREHFATKPCETCGGKGYLPEVAGVPFADYSWAHAPGSQGFPCTACKATGTVAKPEGLADCWAWAKTFARQRRWLHDDQEAIA